jgi:soluble lytic murein transglycosylase-like protein
MVALAGVGAAAFFLLRPRDTAADGSALYVPGETRTLFEDLIDWKFPTVYKSPAQWREELRPLIRRMEHSYAMPGGLLEAVAERESAFRNDIITCEIFGKAGEEGIMQLKPQYHLDTQAQRCNPRIAIPYAAKYLAKNFIRFGTWSEAIAAYNWGPTDLATYGLQAAPAKVKSYIAFVRDRSDGFA